MILLDRERILRTSKRMAYQILEEAKQVNISLLGLNNRGLLFAKLLLKTIESETDMKTELHNLDADDDSVFNSQEGYLKPKDSVLFIIDDVIFSGGTIYRAVQKIGELSDYQKVFVAVLADRGHRKYPIEAKIVGTHVPTKLNEHVKLTTNNNQIERLELIKK